MKDFANVLADFIIERERPRLDKIMQEVAKNIQGDVVAVTYATLDAYYADYDPEVYIRIDDSYRPRGKDGKFRNKKKAEWDKSQDRSLKSAMTALGESGQPAIGVCRPLDGVFGYQAGVLFDPDYFEGNMRHEHKGFTEWDIVENFLFGQHGNGEEIHFTENYADIELRNYLNSYKPKFDKHYHNALKKFKK